MQIKDINSHQTYKKAYFLLFQQINNVLFGHHFFMKVKCHQLTNEECDIFLQSKINAILSGNLVGKFLNPILLNVY